MKRILLVSSNITKEPYPVYPLGLAYIASALVNAGHDIEQFDYLASGESEEQFVTRLTTYAPDYVCISIRNLDNCDSLCNTGYPEIARRIVNMVRAISTSPIIVGGPGFSIIPEELMTYTGADYGIVGEGEVLLCKLISDLSDGKTPKRLTRSSELIHGADMISPLYSEKMIPFYMEKSGMINIQTKRGCSHGCIYCSYPTLEGTRYRCRDPKAVVDDLERVITNHNLDSFFFTDSVFNDDGGHYLLVVEEIIRRKLSLRWCCYMRPKGVGRTELALMKRSGLYAVELGTDAASDALLSSLGKGFSFADALAVNRDCVKEGIPCAHFVMFGGPGETIKTVVEGLENLNKLESTVVFAYSGIRILPGTLLHARAVKDRVLDESAEMREAVYYQSPSVDAVIMNKLILKSFKNRRDRIFPPSAGQEKLNVMHRFGCRGLLWDSLVTRPKEFAC